MKDSTKWVLFSNTRKAAKIRFGLDILMLFIGVYVALLAAIALFENISVFLKIGVFIVFVGLVSVCGIVMFGIFQESVIIFTPIKK
jgi:hypothetical protein